LEIRRDLVRGSFVLVTNDVQRVATKADERALRDVLVPAILSGPQWAATNRADLVVARFDLRRKQATNEVQRAAVRATWIDAAILADEIRRKGGDPYGTNSGQDTEPRVLRVAVPPKWDTLKPVGHTGEPPTLDAIRRAMGGGQ
jgi:hypothetical protein